MDGDDGECIEIFKAPDEWSAMEKLMSVHALCINMLHLREDKSDMRGHRKSRSAVTSTVLPFKTDPA